MPPRPKHRRWEPRNAGINLSSGTGGTKSVAMSGRHARIHLCSGTVPPRPKQWRWEPRHAGIHLSSGTFGHARTVPPSPWSCRWTRVLVRVPPAGASTERGGPQAPGTHPAAHRTLVWWILAPPAPAWCAPLLCLGWIACRPWHAAGVPRTWRHGPATREDRRSRHLGGCGPRTLPRTWRHRSRCLG